MKGYFKKSLLVLALAGFMAPVAGHAYSKKAKKSDLATYVGNLPEGKSITERDIKKAQRAWGKAVVKIGKSKNPAKVARKAAQASYAFEMGPIMFKPTLTHGDQTFRPDLEGTLSYFVGGNDNYSSDGGFAMKPWTKVRFENHNVKIFGNKAIAMGHYYFTDKATKQETKVEYTKGYVKLPDGRVLLFLQDSSLPYSP